MGPLGLGARAAAPHARPQGWPDTLLKFCQIFLKKKLVKMKFDKVLVPANSADGFQGCEEDITIYSTGKCNELMKQWFYLRRSSLH
jgi:hypothetical protein